MEFSHNSFYYLPLCQKAIDDKKNKFNLREHLIYFDPQRKVISLSKLR